MLCCNDMNHEERKAAYNCGYNLRYKQRVRLDYLRDNMVIYKHQMVQRGHAYAIVDEVDSILIDEARTPLSFPAGVRNRPICTKRRTQSPQSSCLKVRELDAKQSYMTITTRITSLTKSEDCDIYALRRKSGSGVQD